MSGPPPAEPHGLRQRIGALALVAVGLAFIWQSLAHLPLGTIDNPGPAAAPIALASLLVIVALWSMTGGASGPLSRTDAGGAEETAAEPGAARHAVLVIAGITAAALVFDHLGYRLTILALLLFFLGAVERKPAIAVLLISFGLSFGSHALFVHVLKVPLPAGPFGL